jgi:S-DNA-T family DNA segregation ATPase FtsK/SpoIIIE
VLVDDAELVEDPDHVLAALAGGTGGDVHVIAAGRVEALRAAYGHWTQVVRRQRRGVILRPQNDLDGDVLATLLPRREATPPAPGRGYLIADGTCAFVQLACRGRHEQVSGH